MHRALRERILPCWKVREAGKGLETGGQGYTARKGSQLPKTISAVSNTNNSSAPIIRSKPRSPVSISISRTRFPRRASARRQGPPSPWIYQPAAFAGGYHRHCTHRYFHLLNIITQNNVCVKVFSDKFIHQDEFDKNVQIGIPFFLTDRSAICASGNQDRSRKSSFPSKVRTSLFQLPDADPIQTQKGSCLLDPIPPQSGFHRLRHSAGLAAASPDAAMGSVFVSARRAFTGFHPAKRLGAGLEAVGFMLSSLPSRSAEIELASSCCDCVGRKSCLTLSSRRRAAAMPPFGRRALAF